MIPSHRPRSAHEPRCTSNPPPRSRSPGTACSRSPVNRSAGGVPFDSRTVGAMRQGSLLPRQARTLCATVALDPRRTGHLWRQTAAAAGGPASEGPPVARRAEKADQ
eukprot:6782895-Prymnesium_polylepis.2